ncbi:MAG: DUF3179 domain-containing protein, partial [Acidimicrobiia bacterium]|nr:DUF3179 domain-containing protein [Acidimicrobiia bacterium]
MIRMAWGAALVLVVAGCSSGSEPLSESTTTTAPPPDTTTTTTTTMPADADTAAAAERLVASIDTGIDLEAVATIEASGDARYAWLLSDFLRFLIPGDVSDTIVAAIESLTDFKMDPFQTAWGATTNHLIAEDIPAPPDFQSLKGALFTFIEPRWAPFFEDPDAAIDYRYLNWGGVRPDDRPAGETDVPCRGGCIPSLDDPAVTDAAGGDWYPDDRIIFGVSIDDEARAYPKNIMEVHEMVIDTVGGVRIGMPYCTLCGSAQAYDLDSVPDGVERPLLRTSGLLSRSNKVMYDLNTWSVFDTFTGEAVSGPLREAGVELEMVSVVVSTWGAWKEEHPNTTIVAEDGGIGRQYAEDPLRGRDDDGPIFPIGDVDERLPVQAQVLGVELPDGG